MTRIGPYPYYKESGLPWLGRIPRHWTIQPLGTCFDERREIVSDKDFTPLSVTMNGIVPQLETAAKTDNGDNRKRVNEGDFVINTRSDRKGSAGVSDLGGSVSVISTVLTPRAGLNSRFVHYLLRSQPFQEEYYRFGTGIVADLWSTRYSSMKRIRLAVPPFGEQESVAGFLDRETAQIDELIGKQVRLIELLGEKRQAIVTHAVTRGLDPTAPTKPSSIPWLGEIPAHWAQKPMCHFMAGRVDYRGATPKKTDDGIFLVTAKNVRKGFIDYSASAEYVAAEDYDSVMSRGTPAIGDILMTMEAPLGNFALIDDPKVALAQRVIKFRPKAELLSAFAIYAANSPYFQAQLEERATGSTALGIKASKLIELRLTAPSKEEQQRIVDFLDAAVGRIDGLTQRAKAAISLLRERRSALISAAVTGKIDVQEGVVRS
jgi:type I restriction enzyme S subunit